MEKKENKSHPSADSNIKDGISVMETGQTGSKKTHQKKNQDKSSKTEAELKKIIEERDDLNDKYLRTLAEMDNYRKRVLKEKEEFRRYILTDFLLEILQVFDNLERALQSKESATSHAVINGVEITLKQFTEILKNFQVQEVEALGKPFNPEFHEALAKVEQPGIVTPTVIEVYQKGFTYNQRLLRPALTKVALPLSADHDTEVPEIKEEIE